MIFKNLNYNLLNEKHIKAFITSVSRLNYGMYLSHMIILILLYQYFKKLSLTGFQTLSFVMLSAISIFLITWIAVLLVNRLSNKFLGYY